MIASHCFCSILCKMASQVKPALLIKISGVPNACWAFSSAVWGKSAFVTSPARVTTLAPVLLKADAVADNGP